MREVSTLELKKKRTIKPETLFLFSLMFLLYSPFAGIYSMSGMAGDTAIQIRIGLDDLAMGKLLTEEICSWHPGLVFTAHESGWYLLLGFMYKMFKLWGIIAVGTIFNYATGCAALSYAKDKAHPFFVALVMVMVPFLNGYPDYNVRPSVTSIFCMTFLIASFMNDKKPVFKAVFFAVSSFFLGWLQGGILPLYMVVFTVFIVIELLYKNFRDAGVLAGGLVAGFILSLLNPMGIRDYTFGMIQSTATDIWAEVQEWLPMEFTMVQAVLILLVFIGFMTDDKLRKFDKKAVTKVALLCMFLIMTCVYTRFVVYYSVCFLMFAPEQLESVLKWFAEVVVKLKKPVKIDLSSGFYKILAAICALMIIGHGVLYVPRYLPTGTFSDVEQMAAVDPGAVQFIQDKGYERIFNTFDLGSWLVYRGVKVHIDNRIDPYMREFSGEDHIRDQMNCTTIAELDVFTAKYDCDAFLLDMPDGFSYLLYEIERYAPERYRVVYDNVVESQIPDIGSRRFVIIECI